MIRPHANTAVVPVYLNGPGQPSNLCDCANCGAFCLHQGQAPKGQLCMAHDRWYETPCDKGRCPGQSDARCCKKDVATACESESHDMGCDEQSDD